MCVWMWLVSAAEPQETKLWICIETSSVGFFLFLTKFAYLKCNSSVSAIICINWWHNFQEADDYEEETNNIWDDDFGVRSAAALHTTTTSTTPEPKIQAASKTNKNLCRRKPLYVDFAEIQYDSWVLAPTGYEVSKKSTFPTTQTKNIIFPAPRHFSAPAGAFTPSAITSRRQSTRWSKRWCIRWARSERKRRAACPPNSNPSPCSTWTTTESSPTGSATRTWLLRNVAVDELIVRRSWQFSTF